MIRPILTLLAVLLPLAGLTAGELPHLPKELDPEKQSYSAQKKLPNLAEPYFSSSPENLGDGLQVGTLNVPGTGEAIKALIADDKAGKYSNLDSILLWKDGRLIFEMYNRRGRVNGPHYAMSITKTLTSITLARAIQLGLLSMDDLDKPVISFMPEIDRSKIKPGVETITLHNALYMESGLRFPNNNFARTLGEKHPRQKFFQALFENTEPITTKSKQFKYTGTDPSMIMMIMDILAPATAQEFIATEVAGKVGALYCWDNQACGIPKCGAGSSFTSRSLLKFGIAVIQGGKYNGKQFLSEDYVKLIMDRQKGEGYFYHFHNRRKKAAGKEVYMISGIGAGGQYMATFPELNIVAVATAHNKGKIGLPLQAVLEHLVPLFVQ
ncbi:MAG: serine hydrolase [Verrucomicrobiaceae bacterium]|nr:serine hydrolase [Verrucomicrobiaceae bacterium]